MVRPQEGGQPKGKPKLKQRESDGAVSVAVAEGGSSNSAAITSPPSPANQSTPAAQPPNLFPASSPHSQGQASPTATNRPARQRRHAPLYSTAKTTVEDPLSLSHFKKDIEQATALSKNNPAHTVTSASHVYLKDGKDFSVETALDQCLSELPKPGAEEASLATYNPNPLLTSAQAFVKLREGETGVKFYKLLVLYFKTLFKYERIKTQCMELQEQLSPIETAEGEGGEPMGAPLKVRQGGPEARTVRRAKISPESEEFGSEDAEGLAEALTQDYKPIEEEPTSLGTSGSHLAPRPPDLHLGSMVASESIALSPVSTGLAQGSPTAAQKALARQQASSPTLKYSSSVLLAVREAKSSGKHAKDGQPDFSNGQRKWNVGGKMTDEEVAKAEEVVQQMLVLEHSTTAVFCNLSDAYSQLLLEFPGKRFSTHIQERDFFETLYRIGMRLLKTRFPEKSTHPAMLGHARKVFRTNGFRFQFKEEKFMSKELRQYLQSEEAAEEEPPVDIPPPRSLSSSARKKKRQRERGKRDTDPDSERQGEKGQDEGEQACARFAEKCAERVAKAKRLGMLKDTPTHRTSDYSNLKRRMDVGKHLSMVRLGEYSSKDYVTPFKDCLGSQSPLLTAQFPSRNLVSPVKWGTRKQAETPPPRWQNANAFSHGMDNITLADMEKKEEIHFKNLQKRLQQERKARGREDPSPDGGGMTGTQGNGGLDSPGMVSSFQQEASGQGAPGPGGESPFDNPFPWLNAASSPAALPPLGGFPTPPPPGQAPSFPTASALWASQNNGSLLTPISQPTKGGPKHGQPEPDGDGVIVASITVDRTKGETETRGFTVKPWLQHTRNLLNGSTELLSSPANPAKGGREGKGNRKAALGFLAEMQGDAGEQANEDPFDSHEVDPQVLSCVAASTIQAWRMGEESLLVERKFNGDRNPNTKDFSRLSVPLPAYASLIASLQQRQQQKHQQQGAPGAAATQPQASVDSEESE